VCAPRGGGSVDRPSSAERPGPRRVPGGRGAASGDVPGALRRIARLATAERNAGPSPLVERTVTTRALTGIVRHAEPVGDGTDNCRASGVRRGSAVHVRVGGPPTARMRARGDPSRPPWSSTALAEGTAPPPSRVDARSAGSRAPAATPHKVIERSGTQPTSNSGDDGTGIEPFDGGANMKTRLFVALSSLATLVLTSGASVAWR
jgi:hypothetical protein